MRQWLVEDHRNVFLDQDLTDSLVVGEQWERRLHERLRWAGTVVADRSLMMDGSGPDDVISAPVTATSTGHTDHSITLHRCDRCRDHAPTSPSSGDVTASGGLLHGYQQVV